MALVERRATGPWGPCLALENVVHGVSIYTKPCHSPGGDLFEEGGPHVVRQQVVLFPRQAQVNIDDVHIKACPPDGVENG